MSKRGLYIGGGTIGYANPKKIRYVSVKPFDTPKTDIIATMKKEKRKAKAKRAAQPRPNKTAPLVAWNADTGVVAKRYQKKSKRK